MERVAVLGAGVAGLAASRELVRLGYEVTTFDKGRRQAGRISTRRGERTSFDHGAQYFTARDPAFRGAVASAVEAGAVARWDGRLVSFAGRGQPPSPVVGDEPRWVGVPGMSAFASYLADGLTVHSSVRIERVERRGGTFDLTDGEGITRSGFERLVCALPAAQAAELLPADFAFRDRVLAVEMAPCLATMVELEARYEVDFDGAFVDASPIAWAARNSSKPGRPERECWVLHATPEWSNRHFDDPLPEIARAMAAELEAVTGRALPSSEHLASFRWRYARALSQGLAPGSPAGFLRDSERRVVACGDWCIGARVEDAWTSGLRAARALARIRHQEPINQPPFMG